MQSKRGDQADARRDEGGDAGGEVSMSIDETNKLRASLGLAPLKADSSQPKGPSEEEVKRMEAEENATKTEQLAARVAAAKERRQQQELLSATKTLGEADAEVDDVMAWVGKSRKVTEEQKLKAQAEQKRKRAAEAARAAQRATGSESEEDGGHGAAELAGMKVKHSAEELEQGETMILTLEDKPILDDKGELREDDDGVALENVLAREDKQRAKAFRDSRKAAKPLWEEDGVKRGLLDKYDEEEEEAMQLDALGAVQVDKEQRQLDVRAKLAAAAAAAGSAVGAGAPPTFGSAGADFYSAEEMVAMQKPRRKKERRLKRRALTEEELSALEADAAARSGGGAADLGSRAQREARVGLKAAEQAHADADRRARFEAALTKANYASLALRQESMANGEGEGEEEDEDLYRSLNKARQLAQESERPAGGAATQDVMAEAVVRRREGGAPAAPAEDAGALTFTDVAEFARTITVKQEAPAATTAREVSEVDVAAAAAEVAAPAAAAEEMEFEGVEAMDEDHYAAAAAAKAGVAAAEPSAAAAGRWGSWISAAGEGGGEEAALPRSKTRQLRGKRQWEEDDGGGSGEGEAEGGPVAVKKEEEAEDAGGLAAEKAIGRGMAGALAFLKERGELERPVEWAGRTMDHRDSYFTAAMGGYKDVYTGGRIEDQLALDVEVALTRRDEFGRVLTPKEAFRQLCHRFHGIQPSQNTREKRARQVAKELAQRKAATGAVEADLMAGAKAVQQKAATPYVVLSGTVRPGQSRDAASGYATTEQAESLHATAPTPVLSGGQTPLTGRAKVEAMLGMKRPAAGGGAESMPPPPSKAPRRK